MPATREIYGDLEHWLLDKSSRNELYWTKARDFYQGVKNQDVASLTKKQVDWLESLSEAQHEDG